MLQKSACNIHLSYTKSPYNCSYQATCLEMLQIQFLLLNWTFLYFLSSNLLGSFCINNFWSGLSFVQGAIVSGHVLISWTHTSAERLLFCWRSKMCACSWSKYGRLQSPFAFVKYFINSLFIIEISEVS